MLARKSKNAGIRSRRQKVFPAIEPVTSRAHRPQRHGSPTVELDAFIDGCLAACRNRLMVEPEKKLMLATLEDAVDCFRGNVLSESAEGKRLFEEAEEWLFDADSGWLFSSSNVCAFLGVDAESLRSALLTWKQRKLAEKVIEDLAEKRL
jgi:hypothetical protein